MRAAALLCFALALPSIAFARRLKASDDGTVIAEAKGTSKVVYGGCFCPPHKGHFVQLEKLSDEWDEVFVFMFADAEQRHGYHPQVNEEIWRTFMQVIPKQNVHIFPRGMSIIQGEPYLTGTQILAQSGLLIPGDKLFVAVGDDYEPERKEGIKAQIASMVPDRVETGIVDLDRNLGGQVSATKFCKALDASAYSYDVGSPIMYYYSLEGNSRTPGVIHGMHESGAWKVKLDKDLSNPFSILANPLQIGPGLMSGDCAIYTSSRGMTFPATIVAKDVEAYTIQFVAAVPGAEAQMLTKVAAPMQIEPCSKVLDPKKFRIADVKDKYIPENLNPEQLAYVEQLLMKKSRLG